MVFRSIFIHSLIILALTAYPERAVNNSAAQAVTLTRYKCSQSAAERDALLRDAESNEYHVRRVEFLGNKHTRDKVLRERIPLLQEGELISRPNLIKSLESVSELKIIYPVRMSDVEIRLDREDKFVDMLICFREKPRRIKRQNSFVNASANKPSEADESRGFCDLRQRFSQPKTTGVNPSFAEPRDISPRYREYWFASTSR